MNTVKLRALSCLSSETYVLTDGFYILESFCTAKDGKQPTYLTNLKCAIGRFPTDVF